MGGSSWLNISTLSTSYKTFKAIKMVLQNRLHWPFKSRNKRVKRHLHPLLLGNSWIRIEIPYWGSLAKNPCWCMRASSIRWEVSIRYLSRCFLTKEHRILGPNMISSVIACGQMNIYRISRMCSRRRRLNSSWGLRGRCKICKTSTFYSNTKLTNLSSSTRPKPSSSKFCQSRTFSRRHIKIRWLNRHLTK